MNKDIKRMKLADLERGLIELWKARRVLERRA